MFEDALRACDAAVDAVMGRPCRHVPRKSGTYAMAEDDTRPSVDFRGVLARAGKVSDVREGRGPNTGLSRAHSSDEIAVSPQEAERFAGRPQRDDLIICDPDTPEAQRFTVSSALRSADGGFQILVTADPGEVS